MQPRQREPLTDLLAAINSFRAKVNEVSSVFMIAAFWIGIVVLVLAALRAWIVRDPDPLDNAAWLALLLFQAITVGTTVALVLLIRPSSRLAVVRVVPSAIAFMIIVAFAYFAPPRGPRAGTVALYAEAIAGGAYLAFVVRSWRRSRARAELPRATARPSGRTQ